MREFLFKGKRKDNGEWIEGFLFHKYFADIPHDRLVIQYQPKSDDNKWTPPYMAEEIIPETVGQYTGLNDSTKWEQLTEKEQSDWLKNHTIEEWNGKKIFEGDILHFKAYRGGGFTCPIGTDIYYRVLFGHCNPDMNTLTEYVGFWALGKNYDEDDLYEYGSSVSYLVNSEGACVIGVNSEGACVIGNIHDKKLEDFEFVSSATVNGTKNTIIPNC